MLASLALVFACLHLARFVLIPVAFAEGGGTVNFELASRQLRAAQKAAEGAPASVNAERSSYLWSATTRPAAGAGLYFAGGKVTTGRNELIDQLAEGTVKRHTTNMYEKLGATSRIDAVRKAARLGLLD